jgi:HTH domain found in ParB protein
MPAVNDRKPDHPSFDFDEDELDPAIEELRPLCHKQRTDTLQWYYTLGKLVAKHYTRVDKERERRNDTIYGQHFFNRLAEAIEVVSAAMLRMCFNLYFYYPEGPAFRELASHKAISPTHALRLASISDGALRRELQERVVEEHLSVRDLDREIKKNQPKPRKPGAGRPMKVPRDVTKALIHLNAQADNFIHCNERVWFGAQFDIIESLTDLPSSLLSDKFTKQLTAAAESCERLARMADADAEKLRDALSEVERRMALQAKFDKQAQEEEEMSCAAAG